MAHPLLVAALRLVRRTSSTAEAARAALPRVRVPAGLRSGGRDPDSPAATAWRFASDPATVSGISIVQDGTSVLVFPDSGPPSVLGAGEIVRPGLRRGRTPTSVVISHHRFSLDLTLDAMRTADDRRVEGALLRVVLQLREDDRSAALGRLAQEHGPDLETELLARVATELAAAVTAVVGTSRLDDLLAGGLSAALGERGLPPSFADGIVVRRGLDVVSVDWPTEVGRAPVAGGSPATSSTR